MLGVAAAGKRDSHPGVKRKLSRVLQSLLFGGGVELVIEDARPLSRLEPQRHRLFIMTNGNASDLRVALRTGIVRLRFLFLSRVVYYPLVPSYIEVPVR